MTVPTASQGSRRRVAGWAIGGVLAALTLTASGVAVHSPGSAPTRVLGQQFTSAPAATGGNNGCGNGAGGSAANKDCTPPGKAVTVTGTVLGAVSPGTSATLRLVIQNPNNQDLTVQSASATVGTPSKANCLARWFQVSPFSGSPAVTVRKNNNATLDLVFTMLNEPVNQDACKSANIPLKFTATAAGA